MSGDHLVDASPSERARRPDPVRSLGTDRHVDLFGVRFPLVTQAQAVDFLVACAADGPATGVCFPDMSTLNIARRSRPFRRLLQQRVMTLNDGAGVALAARLRGRSFPANLNGTDLTPRLLEQVAAGTKVYLLGARPEVVERARQVLGARFPHLRFVGAHHGYLDDESEGAVLEELHREQPDVVLVAMGNPLQVELIDRHLDDPLLASTLWLGIGGLLDFYGGTRVRAPGWMIKARLEWLHIVLTEQHKVRRYLLGIPTFVAACVATQLRAGHDLDE